MEIDKIRTPQDVFTYMDENISYGWLDVNHKIHGIKEMTNFRSLYRTMSVEETVEHGVGTCVEQVALMHELLNRINIKNQMYCCRIFEPDDYGNLEEEEHMHCFVLFYQKNKVYHLEHPNGEKKGIYEYDSEKEAIRAIVDYYIELRGGKESPTTKFESVPTGLSFREFNAYINHQEILHSREDVS